jgi:hypothetical protein
MARKILGFPVLQNYRESIWHSLLFGYLMPGEHPGSEVETADAASTSKESSADRELPPWGYRPQPASFLRIDGRRSKSETAEIKERESKLDVGSETLIRRAGFGYASIQSRCNQVYREALSRAVDTARRA